MQKNTQSTERTTQKVSAVTMIFFGIKNIVALRIEYRKENTFITLIIPHFILNEVYFKKSAKEAEESFICKTVTNKTVVAIILADDDLHE